MASWTSDVVVDAPRPVVFDILADKERWSRLIGLPTSLVQAGAEERQGVGAVHRLGPRPAGLLEEILTFERNEGFTYKIVGRAPVKHHFGSVRFEDAPGGGTRVVYRMELTPSLPLPERVVAQGIRGMLAGLMRGLEREAARRR